MITFKIEINGHGDQIIIVQQDAVTIDVLAVMQGLHMSYDEIRNYCFIHYGQKRGIVQLM